MGEGNGVVAITEELVRTVDGFGGRREWVVEVERLHAARLRRRALQLLGEDAKLAVVGREKR